MKSRIFPLLLIAVFSVNAQDLTVRQPDAMGESPSLASLTGHAGTPTYNVNLYEIEKGSTPQESSKGVQKAASTASKTLTLANTPTTFQATLPALPGVSISKNFAGLGRGFNANWTDQFLVPPDPTIAVGPTQIVQWVNVRLTVMDKSGNPLVGGALGYINGNAIWSGLPAGSICRDTNQGDPMVQYDRLANRWILTQFAFALSSSFVPAAPFAQCIAVSTSPDATGTYSLYQYTYDVLPDYTKIGVWPDAYYFTYNNFSINPTSGGSSFVGAQVCAFDRAAMVAGTAATQICTSRLANRFSFLPADLDGNTLPPAGSPNYVVSQDWFFFASPPYSVRLQKFKPDFANPANSTFGDGIGGGSNSFIQIPLGSLRGACNDNGGQCVPQPGAARQLDTLSMRPMYRLAYRNRGGVESLVFTHSVDPPGPAVASMHWIEIRDPNSASPQVYQNGAINTPDGLNRWMGSAAMDSAGNIALGYAVSSATVSPGVRIAGRYRTDLRNTLRGELTVVDGAGALTSTTGRWGDYSAMQIDPTDDCTFWYTQMYMTGVFTRDWSTRIVAFKFPNCTATPPAP